MGVEDLGRSQFTLNECLVLSNIRSTYEMLNEDPLDANKLCHFLLAAVGMSMLIVTSKELYH